MRLQVNCLSEMIFSQIWYLDPPACDINACMQILESEPARPIRQMDDVTRCMMHTAEDKPAFARCEAEALTSISLSRSMFLNGKCVGRGDRESASHRTDVCEWAFP